MKKYMLFVLSILLVVVFSLLPINIFNTKYPIDYELEKADEVNYIYFIEDNDVIGVPIYNLSENKYTKIKEVFLYLTEKSNSVDVKYNTYLNLNTKLISYEIKKDDLFLELSGDFFKMEKEVSLFALAQILYTYKELGFQNVFLKNNGEVIKQVSGYVTYNGITTLPVNLVMASTSTNTKTIKIKYNFKDNTKSFINYVTNYDTNEVSFVLEKLIEFVNLEYQTSIKLINVNSSKNYLKITLELKSDEVEIIKKIINENFGNPIYDFVIT